MKNKKTRSTLMFIGLMIISIAFILYILVPFNLEKLILFIFFLGILMILYKLWNVATYGFICLNCGYEFKRSIKERIFKKKKCPLCSNHEVIKESLTYYYFKEWSDLDED